MARPRKIKPEVEGESVVERGMRKKGVRKPKTQSGECGEDLKVAMAMLQAIAEVRGESVETLTTRIITSWINEKFRNIEV